MGGRSKKKKRRKRNKKIKERKMAGVLIVRPDNSMLSGGNLFNIERIFMADDVDKAERIIEELPRCFSSGDNDMVCVIVPDIRVLKIIRKVNICDGHDCSELSENEE